VILSDLALEASKAATEPSIYEKVEHVHQFCEKVTVLTEKVVLQDYLSCSRIIPVTVLTWLSVTGNCITILISRFCGELIKQIGEQTEIDKKCK
jgi:hypothetical protein